MNLPEIGDTVLWHPDGDRSPQPYAAVVTAIGMESINVNIFDPFSYNLRIKDGVRHIDDPKAKHEATRDSGAWEHTPKTKRLEDERLRRIEIEEKVCALEERILFLEAVKESGERHATLLERLG